MSAFRVCRGGAAALLVLAAFGQASCLPTQGTTARPVEVFGAWDGRWRGAFVGYDVRGVELYRIAVEQTYRTIDANTQTVEIRDTMSNGDVITGRGRNTAERRDDGTLELHCEVKKSNGDVVTHSGRLVDGPSGRRELVWYSAKPEREETFREWVEGRGDESRYYIHGMGRYDGKSMLMAGSYRRVGK